VPADALPPDAGMLVLEDPEGAPLAMLAITERVHIRVTGPGAVVRAVARVRAFVVTGPGAVARAVARGP
jgi:hypothetical protein